MPTTLRTRRRNNLKHLNYLCFSTFIKPQSPPTSSLLDHNRPSLSEPQPADIATAVASNRFFFSSPGRSNSIVESTVSSSSPAPTIDSNKKKVVLNRSVAVATYSPDPYMDFRQSMQEMVEAQPELMKDVKSNWDTLHDLLLSYLAINPNNTHKFILDAFSDLIVTLMSFSSSSSSPSSS